MVLDKSGKQILQEEYMRKKIVAGNWKMNGRIDSIKLLLEDLCHFLPEKTSAECIVLPPSIYLSMVETSLRERNISIGAQNIYPAEAGAYTGELSVSMLKDFSCNYVLVGHSERRTLFAETEKFIADKFHHVKEHDMIPILCVGETLEDRERGRTETVLANQLAGIAEYDSYAFRNCIIAYEPVWAIGTGKTASPEQIQQVHSILRSLISDLGEENGNHVSLLYGGSVNETNAESIFAMPDVDGGLIGGASLNARQFVEIVKCIK